MEASAKLGKMSGSNISSIQQKKAVINSQPFSLFSIYLVVSSDPETEIHNTVVESASDIVEFLSFRFYLARLFKVADSVFDRLLSFVEFLLSVDHLRLPDSWT